MTISERILKVLDARGMSQTDFAGQVGISASTISEWKKRKTNPSADKIMDICYVLGVTPDQLLTGKGIDGEEEIASSRPENHFTIRDIKLINDFHSLKYDQQVRLMSYMEALTMLAKLDDEITDKIKDRK